MVKKVVLTGGPCSGKTTVLNSIKKYYEDNGMRVIVVSETATELINNGIKCFGEDKLVNSLDYQELVMSLQLEKERIVDNVIDMNSNQDILVIYDRGVMDGEAYVSVDEFKGVIEKVRPNMDSNKLMNNYDMVIVLIGDTSFYTLDTNSARSESASEAISLGKRTLMSWIRHDNIKLVYPKDSIEEKINEVIDNIDDLMLEKKEKYSYAININESDLSCIVDYRVEVINDELSRLYFVIDGFVGILEMYRDSCYGTLKLPCNIDDMVSFKKNISILEPIMNRSLVLKRS